MDAETSRTEKLHRLLNSFVLLYYICYGCIGSWYNSCAYITGSGLLARAGMYRGAL